MHSGELGSELVVEDVVVDGVADQTSHNTDRRDRATHVTISASGLINSEHQMLRYGKPSAYLTVMVTVTAGTNTPPTPKPQIDPSATTVAEALPVTAILPHSRKRLAASHAPEAYASSRRCQLLPSC
jgi:hypothetical protein